MSNKRITELVPINLADIDNSDLLALADVSVPETKRMTMADMANWVGLSASLNTVSASYSNTASHLLYSLNNGTASFAISSSFAYQSYTTSFSNNARLATTASYAETCSFFNGALSGSFVASSANTASFLLYTLGTLNGTASSALSSSWALQSITASFVNWLGGNVNNGTVYNSVSASFSQTASVLIGVAGSIFATASWATKTVSSSYLIFVSDAVSNGTSSNARYAYSASTAAAVSNVVNSNIYREWGPNTSSLTGPGAFSTTASFGYFQVSGSVKIIVEAWGDVNIPQSHSINHSGSVLLSLSESVSSYFQLDEARFQNYFTGSDAGLATHNDTGSTISRFYLKGSTTQINNHRYLLGAYASNGLSFVTGSSAWSGIRCSIKVNGDNVFDE